MKGRLSLKSIRGSRIEPGISLSLVDRANHEVTTAQLRLDITQSNFYHLLATSTSVLDTIL